MWQIKTRQIFAYIRLGITCHGYFSSQIKSSSKFIFLYKLRYNLSQPDLAPYFDIVFRCTFLDLIVVGVILYDGPVPW